jgi:hypothetical protein
MKFNLTQDLSNVSNRLSVGLEKNSQILKFLFQINK